MTLSGRRFFALSILVGSALLLSGFPLHAASTAVDNATNAVYSAGWLSGQTGGFGWDLWSLVPSSGASNTQFLIGQSTVNGAGGIDGSGAGGTPRSWGMFSGSGERADAFRLFINPPLNIGQILSVDIDNGILAPGGTAGLSLLDGNGNPQLTILANGSTFEQYADATGNHATQFQSTTNGFRVTFQLTNTTAYVLTLSNLFNNVQKVYTGTVSDDNIQQVDLFAQATGPTTNFFNRMIVTCGSFPGNICSVELTNGTTCGGQQAIFAAPAGMDSYAWSFSANSSGAAIVPPANAEQVTVNNGSTGSYTLTVTISSGGCTSSCDTVATVTPTPVSTITGSATICAGTTGQLCAPAGMTNYTWMLPNFGTASTQCVLVNTGGTYTVTVTDLHGCVSTSSTNVTEVTGPAILAQPVGQTTCVGGSANFVVTATGAAGFQWFENSAQINNGGTISGATTASLTLTGLGSADNAAQFYVVVSGPAGCGSVNSTPAALTVNPTPQVTPLATPNPVCIGSTLNFSVASSPPADSYVWTTNGVTVATTASFSIANVSLQSAGTYCLVASLNGCKSVQECVTVTVSAPPTLTVGNDSPTCEGAIMDFTAAGVPSNGHYVWTDPNNNFVTTNQNFSISNVGTNDNGNFTCVYTTPQGCTTQLVTTAVVLAPPVTQAFNNGPICPGSTLTLTATGPTNSSYFWTPPAGFVLPKPNQQVISIANAPADAAGTYSVFEVSGNCTSAVTQTAVKIFDLPACSISGSPSLCAEDFADFSGPDVQSVSFAWSIDDPNDTGAYIVSTSNNLVIVSTLGNVSAPTPFILSLSLKVPGCTTSNTCSIEVTVNPTPVISPTTVPPAILNAPFSQYFDTGSGIPPITITFSGLPTWLTAVSNQVYGTPTMEGDFCFNIQAASFSSASESDFTNIFGSVTNVFSEIVTNYCFSPIQSVCIGVSKCLAPTIQPVAFSPLALNTPVSGLAVMMVNSAPPVQLIRISGQLPPGLVFNSDGTITGTPTVLGTYTFEIFGVDANGCEAERFYTLQVVCPAFTVTPASPLTISGLGNPYNQNFTTTGGTGPYTYSVVSGSLPSGMTFTSAGQLSGTPTSGSTVFTLNVQDSTGCYATFPYLLIVNLGASTLPLTPATLSTGMVGVAYSQLISAVGATTPVAFITQPDNLPPGLTLSSAGLLSGTPTEGGAFNFAVSMTDNAGHTGSIGYTLIINCSTISISDLEISTGTVRVVTSEPIIASGGTSPYTFVVSAGALPPGLILTVASNVATLVGEPNTYGNFGFTLAATDAAGCSGSNTYSFTVDNAIVGLGLALTGLPSSVSIDSNVIYTLTVTNAGPSDAIQVVVTDPLPDNLGSITAPGCIVAGNTVTCNLGVLPTGVSTTLTVQATALAAGTVTNTATVAGADPGASASAQTVTMVTLPPMVSFSAAAQYLSADSGSATLVVTRSGDASLPVSVAYSTGGGTAVSGTDYVPASGVLTFAPGVTSQTITITLLNSSSSDKTFDVQLSSPTGGAQVSGVAQAAVNLVSPKTANRMTLVSSGGSKVTVQLHGKGTMSVAMSGDSSIDQINLHATDAHSQLFIIAHGTGVVDVNQITCDGDLRGILARRVNLTGSGIVVDGWLGGLTIRDLTNGAGVTAGGIVSQRSRIRAYVIGNGSVLNFGSGITSLVAAQFGAGQVIAPCLGKFQMVGDRAQGIAATSAAILTIANGKCKN